MHCLEIYVIILTAHCSNLRETSKVPGSTIGGPYLIQYLGSSRGLRACWLVWRQIAGRQDGKLLRIRHSEPQNSGARRQLLGLLEYVATGRLRCMNEPDGPS
jgi:hypothetical protein